MTKRVRRVSWLTSWSYTVLAISLLLPAGLGVSAWVSDVDVTHTQALPMTPDVWVWRLIVYALLLWSWPYLIQRLVNKSSKHYVSTQSVPRTPLLLLIVLYEGLIVHNFLGLLFKAWG